MSQGMTIKGKTAGGQSVPVRVSGDGKVIVAGGGLAPSEFSSWEISSPSNITDLIEYFDSNGGLVRSVLVTFTSTAKSSIAKAEVQ